MRMTSKNFVSEDWEEWKGFLGKDGGFVFHSRPSSIFMCKEKALVEKLRAQERVGIFDEGRHEDRLV